MKRDTLIGLLSIRSKRMGPAQSSCELWSKMEQRRTEIDDVQGRENSWMHPLEDDMELSTGLARHWPVAYEPDDTLFRERTVIWSLK